MRPLLNVLSKIATASAIASSALDTMDGSDPEACRLYSEMEKMAMATMKAFPGRLNQKEMTMIQDRLGKFFDVMNWDFKNAHAQTFMIFNTQQLEAIRAELIEHKASQYRIKAIESLILAEVAIYEHFTKKASREYALCNLSGTRASDIWEEIWKAA